MNKEQPMSGIRIWTGRILKGLLSLFLLVDAIMKIIKNAMYVEGTVKFGLPLTSVQPLGIYLLLSTVLYVLPKTSVLGGVFITAYLGGAVAATYISRHDLSAGLFPIIFCILIWVAEYLREPKLHATLPFIR